MGKGGKCPRKPSPETRNIILPGKAKPKNAIKRGSLSAAVSHLDGQERSKNFRSAPAPAEVGGKKKT